MVPAPLEIQQHIMHAIVKHPISYIKLPTIIFIFTSIHGVYINKASLAKCLEMLF
jgi:hypothetical protein